MRFNRKVQIGLVKEPRNAGDEQPTIQDILSEREKQEAIRSLILFGGMQVVKGIATYMTFDAIRKIAVNRLSK